jgi:hypothetical protein
MIKVFEGNCYIFGPHIDGLYSVEKIARILDDGIIISYFRGNAHQQRHIQEEIVEEASCNCKKDWFYPEDMNITKEEAKIKAEELWKKKYKKLGKYS